MGYYFLQAYSIHDHFFCLSFLKKNRNWILVKYVGLVYYETNLDPLFVTKLDSVLFCNEMTIILRNHFICY